MRETTAYNGGLSKLSGDARLAHIAQQLKKGQGVDPVTVREFLSWFGVQRRGYVIVEEIRSALSRVGVTTEPDFQGTYIDGPIKFILAQATAVTEPPESLQTGNGVVLSASQLTADPTHRIGKLRSANIPPVSVKQQQKVTEAITIMLANDFSQLPVMDGEREVKGVISWTTIGSRLSMGATCTEVRECMEIPHTISADTSLFDAINDIVTFQYVLIRDATNKISGIVTTSDLSLQFRQLAEPFLLLGEIENHLRRIIERGSFTKEELSECCDPDDTGRTVGKVFDLTFGEYIRLLEKPERWTRVQLPIDPKYFIGLLDRVRQIRNDVMHFDPDGISDDDLDHLRKITRFLRQLQTVLPTH